MKIYPTPRMLKLLRPGIAAHGSNSPPYETLAAGPNDANLKRQTKSHLDDPRRERDRIVPNALLETVEFGAWKFVLFRRLKNSDVFQLAFLATQIETLVQSQVGLIQSVAAYGVASSVTERVRVGALTGITTLALLK